MPRYYFHVVMADERSEDPEGIYLPDLEAARDEAKNGRARPSSRQDPRRFIAGECHFRDRR